MIRTHKKFGSAFFARISEFYDRWLIRTVLLSHSKPWIVLFTAGLLTVVSIFYAINNFSIQTNTIDLLFHHSEIQKVNQQLQQVFPSLRDRIIVVIHGDSPHLAESATTRLVTRLKKDKRQFGTIYVPGSGTFFKKNGLLYLSVNKLQNLTHQLVLAEPLLGRVAQDPSLRGLFGMLDQIVGHSKSAGSLEKNQLPRIFNDLSSSIRGVHSGNQHYMPWSHLFAGNAFHGGNRRLVVLTLPTGVSSPAAGRSAVQTITTAESDLGLNPAHGIHVSLTGSIILSLDQLKAVTQGARWSTILSLVLITLILVFGLRSAKLLVAVLTTLLLGLVWTSAFAVFAIGPFNLISVAFAVLFIGLGVDFGIQFCVRYQEELQQSARSLDALKSTASRMGFPLTLAAFAAAASFYSVVPTGYSGIRDLGLIAGAGAFIALMANLTVLPALLTVMKAGRISIPRPPVPFEKFPVHRIATTVVLITVALVIGAIFMLRRVSFDFNLAKLQNQHSNAVKTLLSLEKTSPFSPYSIESIAPSLSTANRQAKKLRKLPSVGQVLTVSSFIPAHQQAKLSIIQHTAQLIPPFALTPPTIQPSPSVKEVCQSMLTLSGDLKSYAGSHRNQLAQSANHLSETLNQFVHHGQCRASKIRALKRLVVEPLVHEIHTLSMALQPYRVTLSNLPLDVKRQFVSANGLARVATYSNLNLERTDALQRFVSQVTHVLPQAGGTPVLFVKGGHIVVSAFKEATLIAIGLIIFIVFAVFRRPRNVLLTVTPLIISVLLTVALMAIFHINFNLANIIVIPLTIGLSVAFGIYVIVRWEHFDCRIASVLKSSIPEGVLVSGLTTLASFGSLSISSDPAMASLGQTLAIALTLILLASLVVLPAILALVEKRIPRASNGERDG